MKSKGGKASEAGLTPAEREGCGGMGPSSRREAGWGSDPPDKKDPLWIIFGLYGAVGIQLALTVVAGWFLGNYFDNRWQTSPWLAITGLVMGFVGGLFNLIRILNWRQRDRK